MYLLLVCWKPALRMCLGRDIYPRGANVAGREWLTIRSAEDPRVTPSPTAEAPLCVCRKGGPCVHLRNGGPSPWEGGVGVETCSLTFVIQEVRDPNTVPHELGPGSTGPCPLMSPWRPGGELESACIWVQKDPLGSAGLKGGRGRVCGQWRVEGTQAERVTQFNLLVF